MDIFKSSSKIFDVWLTLVSTVTGVNKILIASWPRIQIKKRSFVREMMV